MKEWDNNRHNQNMTSKQEIKKKRGKEGGVK